MTVKYTYLKNSNTSEIILKQEWLNSNINFPAYYYDIHEKLIGENLNLIGYVEISKKKFNLLKRKANK
jgi:hypothetical protein